MSLLEEAMESCVILNKEIIADGYGGYITNWTEGTEISCAIVLNNSLQARIAEKDGFTGLYTITTTRALNLQYHDVIKRLRDNKIFRITSDGDDDLTPKRAGLDMRQVSAEEWSLPNG